MLSRDPLTNPRPIIRRVYSYVAYRIGNGPDAEDVTSATMERAVRYRPSYDPRKGDPLAWVLGIARSCVDDHLRGRRPTVPLDERLPARDDTEPAVERLTVSAALANLDDRDRELVAFRYGAGLSSREIAKLTGMTPGSVDVALHRCRERLRPLLDERENTSRTPSRNVPDPASQGSI